MISVTKLRAGVTFQLEGKPYQVIEYRHATSGRGQATIRVKVRQLETGEIGEKVFNSGAKVEEIKTEIRPLQYLYRDGDDCYFMDPRSFEQFSLTKKTFSEKAKFLKEGEEVKILFQEKRPLSFELPNSMVFEVVKADPGVKGDTVSGATKPVTLENGLIVRVPLFIKKGDRVKVDTRTGEYGGRAK